MKKLLTLLFTLVLAITVACINTRTVKAEGNEEESIADAAALATFLSSDNTRTGKLTGTGDYVISSKITIWGTKTLDLNGKTIKADDSFSGLMFDVFGTSTLTITDSSNNKTGVIDGGYSKTTTHSDEITGFSVDGEGLGAKLVINGGTIKNMYSKYGSYAAINNGGSVEINEGALITNCNCNNGGGGAVYNNGLLTFSGGTIDNCGLSGSAVHNYLSAKLIIDGQVCFKNNTNGDISFSRIDNAPIELTDKASTSSPLLFLSSSGIDAETGYVIAKSTGYTGELMDFFKTINGNAYLVEDEQQKTLSLKDVKIKVHPTLASKYGISLSKDEDETGIDTKYQWYKKDILDFIKIGDMGSYKGTYPSGSATKEINFTVSKDDTCNGTYSNYTWTHTTVGNLLLISNLKKGQVLSLDFELESTPLKGTAYIVTIRNKAKENVFNNYSIRNSLKGSLKFTVPEDGDYYINDFTFGGGNKTFSNILVKAVDKESKMQDQTSTTLVHPVSNADIFCRVKYTNKDGYVMNEDSNDVYFGKVAKGYDNQEVKVGSAEDVTVQFETNNVAQYFASESNVKVYIDGMETELTQGTDYDITLPPSNSNDATITLTLKGTYISELSKGTHTFFAIVSDTNGYECVVTNVIIKDNTPTPIPTPDKKDESCEKVIGPTWHWNNKKGICEDTGVVKTYTR